MQAIVERLIAFGEFEVEVFGDDVTLHKPIAEWPVCDVLLSWHSDGFPLDKVRAVSPGRQQAGVCSFQRRRPPVPTHPSPRLVPSGQVIGMLGRLEVFMDAYAVAIGAGAHAQKIMFAHKASLYNVHTLLECNCSWGG